MDYESYFRDPEDKTRLLRRNYVGGRQPANVASRNWRGKVLGIGG